MQDLVTKELADALSTVPSTMLIKLCNSYDIELLEPIDEARYYVEKQVAEAIVVNEVVGVTLLRIREELEGTEEASYFKNALTDNLIIRMNRASETASRSSTY